MKSTCKTPSEDLEKGKCYFPKMFNTRGDPPSQSAKDPHLLNNVRSPRCVFNYPLCQPLCFPSSILREMPYIDTPLKFVPEMNSPREARGGSGSR